MIAAQRKSRRRKVVLADTVTSVAVSLLRAASHSCCSLYVRDDFHQVSNGARRAGRWRSPTEIRCCRQCRLVLFLVRRGSFSARNCPPSPRVAAAALPVDPVLVVDDSLILDGGTPSAFVRSPSSTRCGRLRFRVCSANGSDEFGCVAAKCAPSVPRVRLDFG
jgi:hypothetical protein